jgi:hypothetical protein
MQLLSTLLGDLEDREYIEVPPLLDLSLRKEEIWADTLFAYSYSLALHEIGRNSEHNPQALKRSKLTK